MIELSTAAAAASSISEPQLRVDATRGSVVFSVCGRRGLLCAVVGEVRERDETILDDFGLGRLPVAKLSIKLKGREVPVLYFEQELCEAHLFSRGALGYLHESSRYPAATILGIHGEI